MNLTHTAVLILAFVLRLYIEKIEAFCRGWACPSPYECISYYGNDGQGQAQPSTNIFPTMATMGRGKPSPYYLFRTSDVNPQQAEILFNL